MNKKNSQKNSTKRLKQQGKSKSTKGYKWGDAMRKSFNQNLDKKVVVA